MAGLFKLTNDQQRRIGDAVRAYERTPPAQKRAKSGTSTPTGTFFAVLTGEIDDPDKPARYSWIKQYRTLDPITVDARLTLFADAVPEATSDEQFTAYAVNARTGYGLPMGTIVELTFQGYDGSEERLPIYTFHAPDVPRYGKCTAIPTPNAITIVPCSYANDDTPTGAPYVPCSPAYPLDPFYRGYDVNVGDIYEWRPLSLSPGTNPDRKGVLVSVARRSGC
jgi:hypothetical protein